jgi:hypothetical protein
MARAEAVHMLRRSVSPAIIRDLLPRTGRGSIQTIGDDRVRPLGPFVHRIFVEKTQTQRSFEFPKPERAPPPSGQAHSRRCAVNGAWEAPEVKPHFAWTFWANLIAPPSLAALISMSPARALTVAAIWRPRLAQSPLIGGEPALAVAVR